MQCSHPSLCENNGKVPKVAQSTPSVLLTRGCICKGLGLQLVSLVNLVNLPLLLGPRPPHGLHCYLSYLCALSQGARGRG